MNPELMVCARADDGGLTCLPYGVATGGPDMDALRFFAVVVVVLCGVFLVGVYRRIEGDWPVVSWALEGLARWRKDSRETWLRENAAIRSLPELYDIGDHVELMHHLRTREVVPHESVTIGAGHRAAAVTTFRPKCYTGAILERSEGSKIIGSKRYSFPLSYVVVWDDGTQSTHAPDDLRRTFATAG